MYYIKRRFSKNLTHHVPKRSLVFSFAFPSHSHINEMKLIANIGTSYHHKLAINKDKAAQVG